MPYVNFVCEGVRRPSLALKGFVGRLILYSASLHQGVNRIAEVS